MAKSKAKSPAKSQSRPAKAAPPAKAAKPAREDELPARKKGGSYTAADIEVLEGLEPVRRRPGMYVGGTDERALHHLAAEVIDNAMDEVVAGHASRIEIHFAKDGSLTIGDNGRGIPVDPHPRFKTKSALEVILTMLHSGGKFGGDAYKTSGGLHGVGISVVNALADHLVIEVARDGALWTQSYSRGKPTTKLKKVGPISNRRGTTVTFTPDPDIFGKNAGFKAVTLYRMAKAKAYLISNVEIRWSCDPEVLDKKGDVPEKETIHFEGGIVDYLNEQIGTRPCYTPKPFTGTAEFEDGGKIEWAVAWPGDEEGFCSSYVNTVPTSQGGSHEQGFRNALTRALRDYGELLGNKRAAPITAEDLNDGSCTVLSLFIANPQFQGQTKERLGMPQAQKIVEQVVKDHFDHFLTGDPPGAKQLLDHVVDRAEERMRRRQQKEFDRKTATRKLRLPGKLADCSAQAASDTELFIVEGDSAGGSAKQARDRRVQAILPLRGKILNVASASADKLRQNQELSDLVQALGCGTNSDYDESRLRYGRIIIMTDADVDGAHIASLLLTFFYREMPDIIHNKHLYLAMPPLYRLANGGDVVYARDDAHKDEIIKKHFGTKKVEISRFKGLGEMPASQLKETTMDPKKRILLRVSIPKDSSATKRGDETSKLVESLMGRKPELRFAFIQEHAKNVGELDV